jgi:transcriptional regulator with XRE-family HTH domain
MPRRSKATRGNSGNGLDREIDKIIAANIRINRHAGGISQTALGDALGITFQQVQKYEKGANRIGAGRLFQIADIFKVPVAAMYHGADVKRTGRITADRRPHELLTDPFTMRAAAAFARIKGPRIRLITLDLIEQLAEDKE